VVSGGPQSFSFDPDVDFAASETCTVTVFASQVSDQDSDDPPDNMAADFTWSFGPGEHAPVVFSTSPSDGATGVALNAGIEIDFSEAVDVTGAWFSIVCTASGSHTAMVSGGPQSFSLDPDVDFTASESCTVSVLAGQVTDQDADDPPDNMAADFTWSFTTVASGITAIAAMQESASALP
jgi:hypothetical protein